MKGLSYEFYILVFSYIFGFSGNYYFGNLHDCKGNGGLLMEVKKPICDKVWVVSGEVINRCFGTTHNPPDAVIIVDGFGIYTEEQWINKNKETL